MLAVYHKIPWVERVVLNALAKRLRRLILRLWRLVCHRLEDKTIHQAVKLSFIRHFPFVENGSGGVYRSGQTSNPALECPLFSARLPSGHHAVAASLWEAQR
jgi:hypothetical protein